MLWLQPPIWRRDATVMRTTDEKNKQKKKQVGEGEKSSSSGGCVRFSRTARKKLVVGASQVTQVNWIASIKLIIIIAGNIVKTHSFCALGNSDSPESPLKPNYYLKKIIFSVVSVTKGDYRLWQLANFKDVSNSGVHCPRYLHLPTDRVSILFKTKWKQIKRQTVWLTISPPLIGYFCYIFFFQTKDKEDGSGWAYEGF